MMIGPPDAPSGALAAVNAATTHGNRAPDILADPPAYRSMPGKAATTISTGPVRAPQP